MSTFNYPIYMPYAGGSQHTLIISGAVNCDAGIDERTRYVGECDRETVRRAQQGDAAAWEVLVRQNVGWVLYTCRRWVGSIAQAEDLTQDVWLKVFQNIHSYRGEVAGFRTWLRRIIRNLLIDDYRRSRCERNTISYDSADERMKSVVGSIPARGFNPEAGIHKLENKAALRKAFRSLTPKQRQAVILRDVQGLTYEEISTLMKTPVGTVKSRVNRGRIEMVPLIRRHTAMPPRFSSSTSAVA